LIGIKMIDCEKCTDENKCILHCEKSTYNIDFRKIGFLNNFYDELIEYIINFIGEKRIIELFEDYWDTEYNDENHPYYSIQSNSIVSLLKPYFNNEEYVNNLFDFLFKDRVIVFNHIFFPEHDGRDDFDYMKILSKLKRIRFNYCKFSTTYLELNNIEVFFQDCEFFDRYSISNSKLLTNESNVIYQMCIFNKDIYISKMDNKENIIENTLFSDCEFKKKLEAEDISFKKGIFNNTKYNEYIEISKIRFFNCIIGNDFILQGYKIGNLDLSETTFLGKTKIQYCEIEVESLFYNTKFEDLADFYRTKFNKINFESDGTEGVFVYVGGEYMNNYKGLDYGIPLYLSYDATSDDEISLLTGLNYNRKISLEKLWNTGVTFNFVDNDNYKGLDLGLYGNFMLRKKMNYNLFSKITTSIYDENSFEENKIELALTVDKLLKEKYYVFSKYSIEYIDGSYEVEGEGRRDLINTLKIGYKQNVFRDDITLGVDYTYANDDVNFEGYSSSKNIINTSVKWEF